jgi:hypothetical protein
VRWITDRIAIGHSTLRNTEAMLGGEVRGRKASARPVRKRSGRESALATSEPYTGGEGVGRQAGQYVSVSGALPLSR